MFDGDTVAGTSTAVDTVVGFSRGLRDRIAFEGATKKEIKQIVVAQTHERVDGVRSTTITLPDGTQLVLVGVRHVTAAFFA